MAVVVITATKTKKANCDKRRSARVAFFIYNEGPVFYIMSFITCLYFTTHTVIPAHVLSFLALSIIPAKAGIQSAFSVLPQPFRQRVTLPA
jgi:hypothetical protein